ncbi:MAG TPA: YraN family protein [Nitrospiria bacterium]|nr:YraN family protein [Nitrospiria bacterium]
MLNDPQRFGRESEGEAARHLQRAGYRIVARNYRTPFGEIDLVAYDGAMLAFVEVKARRSERFGAPHEAVTAEKRRRLTRAALAYLARVRPERDGPGGADRGEPPPCRFDLVIIERGEQKEGGGQGRIELLKDVFSPSGEGG